MKILILGDLMGNSGKKALQDNLSKIVIDKNIDFTILNGENAAEDGKGITKDIANELFDLGVDVISLETISKHDYLISGKPINKIDILFKKIEKKDD